MRCWIASLAATVLVAAAACTSAQSQGEWIGDTVTAPSDRVLWECTVFAFEKQGFPVGAGFDPATWTATSGWRNDLNPFRGMGDARQGFREQATIRFTKLEAQQYRVDVRVEHQVNNDIARPLDLSYADWKPSDDNVEEAQLLLQLIRSQLGQADDFEPGRGAPRMR